MAETPLQFAYLHCTTCCVEFPIPFALSNAPLFEDCTIRCKMCGEWVTFSNEDLHAPPGPRDHQLPPPPLGVGFRFSSG